VKQSPGYTPTNLRVFIACLLTFTILITPFAALAAPTKQESGVRGQGSETNAAANDVFVKSPNETSAPALPGPKPEAAPEPLAPPVGSVTATISASVVLTANNTVSQADPGDTINYTATLSNTTSSDATGLSFNDIFDSHTAFVGSSIKSTPVGFDQSFPAFDEDPGPAGKTITLQGQDPDGDLPSNAFSIVGGSGPSHGTLDPLSGFSCASGVCSVTVVYHPTQNYNGTDSFQFKVDDGDPNPNVSSAKGTVGITINAVNDAPTITVPGSQITNEDTQLTFSSGNANLISVADVDDGGNSEKVSLSVAHGTIQLATTSGLVFVDGTANNTATLHFTGTLTNLNAALNGMKYTPAADFNNTRGSESLSVTINDQGNTGSGGALSAGPTSVPISIPAVNDKPVAATKNFNVQANMKISYQINLAANGSGDVTDVDNGDGSFTNSFTLTSVTGACTSVIPAGASSTCTISNINANTGTFDFDPPAGMPTSPTISLSYTVTDNGNPLPPQTSNAGTINITVQNPVVWFVDPTRVNNGNGTLSNTSNSVGPFNNLADAAAKVANGTALNQRVFVYSGTTASGDTIALQGSTSGTLAQAQAAAHWLIGQGAVATNFDTLMGFIPPAGTITRPTLSSNATTANGMRPTIRGTVTMKENTTVRGLKIDVSGVAGTPKGISATGLAGGSSGSALIIGDVNVTSAGGNAVDIGTASGTSSVTYTTSDSTNSPNTLSSTTGIALNVVSTTIGAGGLNFKSISAGTVASGPTNGIVLNNTGSSGGLTVTGDGTNTNNSSGGTIQKTTGDGISLTNTQNISLTAMNIQSTAHSGVYGFNNVQNFSFVKGTINNSGTASGSGDSNIAFSNGEFSGNTGVNKNISGTLTITGSTLTNAYYSGIDVYQFDGTISNANISNNTWTSSTSTASSKSTAILLQCLGSATTVSSISKGTINSNTITNFPSNAGIFISGGNAVNSGTHPAGTYGTDATTNILAINSNIITGQASPNQMGTQGIVVTLNGRGTGFFSANSNQVTNVKGNGIQISAFGLTTLTGFIIGNTINAHNQSASQGLGLGTGNTFASSDTPTLNLKVGDGTVGGANIISNTDGNGILAVARSAAGHLNIRILKNTVSTPIESPPSGTTYGIRVDAGNLPSVDDAVCLEISGNTTSGNDDGAGTHAPGIGLRKQGTVSTTNDFGIVGMISATASPNVENYVNGLNPGSASGSFGVGGTALISAQSGFSNCTTMPTVLAMNTYAPRPAGDLAFAATGYSDPLFASSNAVDTGSRFSSMLSGLNFATRDRATQSTLPSSINTEPSIVMGAAVAGESNRVSSDSNISGSLVGVIGNATSSLAQAANAVGSLIVPTAYAEEIVGVRSQSSEAKDQKTNVRLNHAVKAGVRGQGPGKARDRGQGTGVRAHHARNSKLKTENLKLTAAAPMTFSGGLFPVNGTGSGFTLPAGKTITITFSATLNNPPNLAGPTNPKVTNTGNLSGTFTGSPLSPSVDTNVDLFNTTNTLTPGNGNLKSGESVTFTAVVAFDGSTAPSPGGGATPTGTVNFKDNGVSIGGCSAVALTLVLGQKQAQCTTSFTAATPSHPITAEYSGDGNFDPKTSNTSTQTLSQSGTTTTIGSSKNPSNVNETVTYTATVASTSGFTGPPTGIVTFRDGAPLGSVITCSGGNQTLNGSGVATCQVTYADTVGSPHTINAYYPGDTNFTSSNSEGAPVTQTVNTCVGNAVVTSTADDGSAGTLRSTISTLCDGGTITFNLGAGSHTIVLADANGELPINKNLTITGPGSSLLTVQRGNAAANNFRIFEINPTFTVTISGMTISNGNLAPAPKVPGSPGASGDSATGGGILNNGTLTLQDVIVSGNHITAGKGGDGAMSGDAGGNGGDANGGGIFNAGTLTLTNSTVSGNTATGGAGGDSTAGTAGSGGSARGGGVYSITGALTITNSTISSNTTTPGAAGGGTPTTPGTTGGSAGGGVYGNGTALTISGSTFSANHATGAGAEGGGIDNEGGTLSITNSTISGNLSDGSGGGLLNCGNSTATLTSVTITGNSADADNDANGAGGGIDQISINTITLRNTIVAGNLKGSPILQGETATVVGSITADGNAKVIVTAAGMPGTGTETVSVPVTNGQTADDVAGNMRTALAANANVNAFFTISGTTNQIILTTRTVAANDPTLNIETDNDGCSCGLTDSMTSSDTPAGRTAHDIAGTVDATSSFNLIGDANSAGGLAEPNANNNLVGVVGVGNRHITTILNSTLTNNGGPTFTHALVNGSVAVDAGDDFSGPATTDQRGFTRPVDFIVGAGPGDESDIGAFERQVAPNAPNAPTLDPASDSDPDDGRYTSDTTNIKINISGVTSGATVDLYRDDDGAGGNPPAVVASGTAGGNTIQLTDPGPLTAGTDYSYTAKQTLASLTSDASPALTVTVDTTPPNKPSKPLLDPASDSGDTLDNKTNDSTPTFTGTAEAGSTVKLFEGANQIGSTTASGGNWSITSSTLTNGTYSITATATDLAGNTSSASDAQSVYIDATPPVVSSITRANASPTNATSVDFTVTFSEPVIGVDSGDFTLTTTGVSSPMITNVTGSGATRTVTVGTGTGDGTIRLDVVDNDTIMDSDGVNTIGNPLGGSGAGNGNFTAGETYTIAKSNPVVQSITRVSATPSNAATVQFTVTFSKSVTGVNIAPNSDFALTTTGSFSVAPTITTLSGSGAVYTVTVNTGTGDGTIRLDVTDDDTIVDSGSRPLGGTGAGNGDFTTGEVYTIDKTVPTVTINQRTDPPAQADPAIGPTASTLINFTVEFSEEVNGFDTSDVDISTNTAGASTVTISEITARKKFNVAIGGMTQDGNVIATIKASAVTDPAGNANGVSSSTDNTVAYKVDNFSTLEVNTTADPGSGGCTAIGIGDGCTLREAITAANADFGAETITFNIPNTDPGFVGGVYTINLTGALPDLSSDMTISGPGANVLTVKRNTGGSYGIFNISSGSINVTIAGLTINNGDAGVGSGGGIFNNSTGTVNVNNCTISGNAAGADGGGILNSVAGTLNVTNSTINGNTASQGAGLSILAASTVNITNSTISGNAAAGNAGGIFNALATLTISNSTIANNRADSDNNASGAGGGIFRSSGTVTLKSTIVGDNLKGAATLQVETATVVGTITSAGNATVTVTAAGMNNTPKTLNVAVANADSASAVAGKMRTALSADPDVSAFFTVSGATDKIVLTTITAAPNDTTMNIATANGTSAGLTAQPTSANTTAGATGDDINGTVQSDGFNLIQTLTGATINANAGAGPNVTGLDPQLNLLANNGGPTQTHSLKCTSKATDNGTSILATLNGDIDNSTTSVIVNSATYIPAGVGYTILIDSEQMVVISKATNTLTVTRGANATTPATHANGTNVIPASSTDQRGGSRPFDLADSVYPNATGGDGSDIGAYETQSGGGCVPDAIEPNPQPSTNEDNAVVVQLKGTYSQNTNLTFSISQSPANGSLGSISAANCVFTVLMTCTATVTYTPNADYNGADTFKFKAVTNPGGLESDPADVNVTINSVNDPPTFFTSASDTVDEDSGLRSVANFANTISAGPANESGQTVQFMVTGNTNPGLFASGPAIDPTGTLSYAPAADANGSATITVVLKDNGGGTDTSTPHNFTINVNSVNDVPSFTKGADQSVAENAGAQTVNNWATNISKGPANESSQTVNFIVSNDNNTLFSAQPAISATGTLTYTPAANTSGSATVSVQIHDNGGVLLGGVDTSAVQTFKITVNDGGTLQFSAATYSVSENAGPAAITITRTGGSAGTATVKIDTSNGTATAGSDYTTVSQTVTFNDGELSKIVNIPITDDLLNEPDETVNLALSNVGGSGQLGTPIAAVLTITNDDPTGGYIKFSTANYNTTESSGSATITVQRLGTLTSAVTVDYATSDDSDPAQMVSCAPAPGNTIASSRCDFNTATGRLSWAAGDGTSKTFTVLINQDGYVEGPESLSLTLSNLTGGATFATPSTATLTIADDDLIAPTTNPIDDANTFVRQHYHDFLNREPDAAGLAFWTNQITSCGADTQCTEVRRINVSVSFFLSLEFQATGGTAYLTNKVAFGALPNYVRFETDAQAIGLNYVFLQPGAEAILEANKVAYFNDYVSRTEFTNTYNGVSDQTYVNTLISNTGVSFTQTERDALLNGLLNHTETRATVLRKITEKPSFAQSEFTRMFVLMEYFGYLRRNPDTPGFNFWLNKLNLFNGNYIDAEMVKAFISSIEYRRRFAQ
jgi:CSLREA domain-containing protein